MSTIPLVVEELFLAVLALVTSKRGDVVSAKFHAPRRSVLIPPHVMELLESPKVPKREE